MSSRARFRRSTIALSCLLTAIAARPGQSQMSKQAPISAPDSQAQAELGRIIAGLFSDTSSHMRMGPTRTATVADSARAAAIVVATRTALSRYMDVKLAERDGYYRTMASLEDLPIYHYNSLPNFNAASQGNFDLTKPVSLLYQKDTQGQMKLVGAMYAARDGAAPTQLDSLLPISMAHWHEHVNLCYPYRGPRKLDASAVFWLKLYFSITSASECAAAGGQFVPSDAGWMAHIYMFAGDGDPKVIWDTDDAGNMNAHAGHRAMDVRP